MSPDLYEEAVREWIARRIRSRGHSVTREQISDVKYEIDSGFHGTDVTPGDEPVPALKCTMALAGHPPYRHAESVEFWTPASLVEQMLAIYVELVGESNAV